MKKIILVIGLVSSLMVKLEAQSPATKTAPVTQDQKKHLNPEERAKKDAQRAVKTLTLNPDQTIKWESAALERAKATEPLRAKMEGCTTPADRTAIHEEMKLNKQKFNTTVLAMLTPEQKTKYDQMKKDRHKHGHKMRGRHGETPAGPQKNNPN